MNVIIAYSDNPAEKAAAHILDALLAKLMPKAPRAEGPLNDDEKVIVYDVGGE